MKFDKAFEAFVAFLETLSVAMTASNSTNPVVDFFRCIYGSRPFQRVQICEDRSLETGDMSGQGDCLRVKNIHL
jgi:hypothetical protein